jgi:hypothetical protein
MLVVQWGIDVTSLLGKGGPCVCQRGCGRSRCYMQSRMQRAIRKSRNYSTSRPARARASRARLARMSGSRRARDARPCAPSCPTATNPGRVLPRAVGAPRSPQPWAHDGHRRPTGGTGWLRRGSIDQRRRTGGCSASRSATFWSPRAVPLGGLLPRPPLAAGAARSGGRVAPRPRRVANRCMRRRTCRPRASTHRQVRW